jgi:hypothetical protein
MRSAAKRNTSARSRRCLAISTFNWTVEPTSPTAVAWSLAGALLCEAGLHKVPHLETLVLRLGKPIELLMDQWPALRAATDLRIRSVVEVLDIIHDLITEEALRVWWRSAIARAQAEGL